MNRRSSLEFSPGAAGPILALDETDPLAWQALAECQYTDPEIFFPDKGGSVRAPKRICRDCIVRSECLEYALANGERWGIWGGTSEVERRRILRHRNRTAPGLCAKGLHVMDDANTLAFGACRACRNDREAGQRDRAQMGRAA